MPSEIHNVKNLLLLLKFTNQLSTNKFHDINFNKEKFPAVQIELAASFIKISKKGAQHKNN